MNNNWWENSVLPCKWVSIFELRALYEFCLKYGGNVSFGKELGPLHDLASRSKPIDPVELGKYIAEELERYVELERAGIKHAAKQREVLLKITERFFKEKKV